MIFDCRFLILDCLHGEQAPPSEQPAILPQAARIRLRGAGVQHNR
jgi:hypothetical protein